MYYLSDFCCICLWNNKNLQQLSTSDDDNITYLFKLISSVPEMCFNEMNDRRLLCKECCDNINTTYKFRQRCLKSKIMLIDYISQLRSVSNVSGKISIYLTDCYPKADGVLIKSDNKIERTIDNSNIVNKIKTEPNEVNVINVDHEIEEIFLKTIDNYEEDNYIDENISLNTDVGNETNYLYKLTNNSEIIIKNQDLEVINKSKKLLNDLDQKIISKFNQNNQSTQKILLEEDKLSQTDTFKIRVGHKKSKNGSEGLINNLNLLDSKTENNIDGHLTEELIIKTEENYNVNEKNMDYEIEIENVAQDKRIHESTSCVEVYTDNLEVEVANKIQKTHHISSSINLKDNMKTHMEEKLYKCDLCQKSFTRLRYRTIHMRIHRDGQLYKCDVCQKSYSRSRYLNLHMRIHTGERPYECTVCKKTFNQSHNLSVHMRTHTGERPYACTVCNKKFVNSQHCKTHMRTHTGERPYECSTCNKKFSYLQQRDIHMRTHTGERPYVCTVCKKKSICIQHHISHMRTHTGERPYECPICKRVYTQTSNLITHMITHTDDQAYICTICNETFVYSNELSNHMKIKHSEKLV